MKFRFKMMKFEKNPQRNNKIVLKQLFSKLRTLKGLKFYSYNIYWMSNINQINQATFSRELEKIHHNTATNIDNYGRYQ